MSTTHRTVPTPNPAERSLVVTVSESSFATTGGVIPPAGTLYSSPLFKTYFGRDYMKQFANFVYTWQVEEYGLAFARDKTVTVANTPFRVTTSEFGDHHWPAILKALTLQEDPILVYATPSITGNAQGITTAPRYYQQEEYINPVDEGSRFVLYEFFGPRPFVIPRYPVPQAARIAYQTATREGSFPECLHDDVEIPGTRTATASNAGGTTTAVGGSLDGQFFPRTNFKSWRPYVKKSGQKQQDGGWYRYLIRVFPPRLPRRIRENS